MWRRPCVSWRARKPVTSPGTCSTSTAECTCSECLAHLVQSVRRASVENRSNGSPARGHPLVDEALGDADQGNSARRCDMAGGGIVTDEQFGSGDFGGEGGERSFMGSDAGWDRALDPLAFRGAAAFIYKNARAGRCQQPHQFAFEIVLKAFGVLFSYPQ